MKSLQDSRTSLSRIRDEIENKAEAEDVPLAGVLTLFHLQEILLPDVGVLRIEVDGRVIYPGGTPSIIVCFQCSHLEQPKPGRQHSTQVEDNLQSTRTSTFGRLPTDHLPRCLLASQ